MYGCNEIQLIIYIWILVFGDLLPRRNAAARRNSKRTRSLEGCEPHLRTCITNVRLLVNISKKSQKKSTSVGHPLSIKHGKLENSSIAVIGSRHVVTSLVEFSQIWNLMKSPWFKDVQMSRIPWQNSIIFVA
jgi:hypothetical protein